MKLAKLVSVDEVSKIVGVGVQTIRRWRQAGQFPEGIRFGRRTLRWNEDVILAWLADQEKKAAELTNQKEKEHANHS